MTRFSILAGIVALALAGCAAPTATPRPTPSDASLPPMGTTEPSPTGGMSSASPSAPPASATLPVQGSAREHSDHPVVTAPAPDGGLFVLIPVREAPAVLALLDTDGRPVPGWPIAIPGATSCDQLLAVEDGSVRVVCTMANPDGNMYDPVSAFAFDRDGRLRSGWPVAIEGYYRTARIIGEDLTVFVMRPLGDVESLGPTSDGGLVTITADGGIEVGARVPGLPCCGWTVGRDGIGYGVTSSTADQGPEMRTSRMMAVGPSGMPTGWPTGLDGAAGMPTSAPDGSLVLVVAHTAVSTSRIVRFDASGLGVNHSGELPIATAEHSDDVGGCTVGQPQAPVVAENGTTFAYSELDDTIHGFDASLDALSGWPFEPVAPLVRARPGFEYEHEAGYCPTPVVPAAGPDGTLYAALKAPGGSGGGHLVAVGRDGRIRPGWPVVLTRTGAEFWSVVVGWDGTVFAVAFEPEVGGTSSASVLAIAPDSHVRWTTTIIEP